LRKTKINDVTPAKPVLSEIEGAGVQSEKLDSCLRACCQSSKGTFWDCRAILRIARNDL